MNRFESRLGPFRVLARGLLRDPARVRALLRQALAKLDRNTASEALNKVRTEATLMLDLLKAWVRGEYTQVAPGALVGIAAALLYLLAPVDAVPDFIAGLGLVDDAAVLGYVVSTLRDELDAFRNWRADRGVE